MISRNFRLAIGMSLGLLLPVAGAAQSSDCLYAIDFNASSTFTSQLYRVNSANGTMIGAGLPIIHNGNGLSSMVDVEFKSDGFLYAVTTFGGAVVADRNRLFKINPITGQAQLIGPLNIGNIGEGDLSFDSAEVLYLTTSDSPARLYTVNLTSGAGTLTGSLPGINRDLSSLGFNGANELWAIDNGIFPGVTRLLKLNPVGGAILPPTPQTILTLGGIGGMDWSAAQGRFYTADGGFGGTNVVRLLNTAGPSFTTVGTTNIPGGIAGLTVCRACVTPPSGMAAWYPFDELAGPAAHEIAPLVPPVLAHNPGVHTNGPAPIPGVVLNGLHFDGVDDYVEAPHQSWLNVGTGNLSIDLWIRVPANPVGQQVILDKRANNPTLHGYHLVLQSSGEPLLQLADGLGTAWSNYLSGFTIDDGLWHHLAVTVDRTGAQPAIRWYLDGAAVGTVGNPSGRLGSLDNTAPLRLGRRSAGLGVAGSFLGDMDELEIFRRALSAGEVQALFAAGPSGKCKSGGAGSFPEEEPEK